MDMKKRFVHLLLKVSTSSRIDGCWEWGASKNKCGYGTVTNESGGSMLAHRAMWEVVNGKIPDGMEVCHECDNPACINHDHLFLGTHQENMTDCKNKGRAVGHPGEKNRRAKLTEADVIAIRASKMNKADLARKYSVSHSLIRFIKNRTAWKHVQDPVEERVSIDEPAPSELSTAGD